MPIEQGRYQAEALLSHYESILRALKGILPRGHYIRLKDREKAAFRGMHSEGFWLPISPDRHKKAPLPPAP